MSFDILPEELLFCIITKLNYTEIIALGHCTKNFLSITTNNCLWRQKLIQDFPACCLPNPKLEDSGLYFGWYCRLGSHLTPFHIILENSEYDVDEHFLKMLDQIIVKIGPHILVQTKSLLSSELDKYEYEIDEHFKKVIEDALINGFGSNHRQPSIKNN